LAAANQADRALQRTCIGRIVSLLTLIFIFLCGGGYLLALWGLHAAGVLDQLPGSIRGGLIAGIWLGLLAAIVLAGLIGNWIRRRLWRALLRRR